MIRFSVGNTYAVYPLLPISNYQWESMLGSGTKPQFTIVHSIFQSQRSRNGFDPWIEKCVSISSQGLNLGLCQTFWGILHMVRTAVVFNDLYSTEGQILRIWFQLDNPNLINITNEERFTRTLQPSQRSQPLGFPQLAAAFIIYLPHQIGSEGIFPSGIQAASVTGMEVHTLGVMKHYTTWMWWMQYIFVWQYLYLSSLRLALY